MRRKRRLRKGIISARNAEESKVECLGLLGVLGLISVEDIKTHKIKDLAVLLGVVLGFLLHLMFHRISVYNMLGGIMVGCVLYVISILSEGQIGKGDALLFMMTGAFLGFAMNIVLMWVASLCLCVYGGVKVLCKKASMKDRVAFAPFVLAAYIVIFVVQSGAFI